jgi:hypothetical protein
MPTPEELILAKAEWDSNITSSIIKFLVVTVILTVVLVLLFAVGNIQEIAQNWPRYRCNPAFMPFAGAFGYNVQENFQFCLNAVFKSKAGEVFAPIYGLLGNFTNIVTLMIDTTLGIRKLFSNFFLSTNSFIRNVRDRIQGLLFQIRLTFLKMQTLMGRVYGSMYSMIWMGSSAVTAGFNLSENSMIKFIFDHCFDPATRIPMADGTVKAIETLRVGDLLAGDKRVTSTFVVDGNSVPAVELQGVRLSSTHLVVGPTGAMIAAGDHPAATPIPSIPRLICLNVEGHRFQTESGLVVADYDESENPAAIQEAQQIAEAALNGGTAGQTVTDYSLGLDNNCEVQMADGSWKPITAIQIGDVLMGGNPVHGLVEEECANTLCIDYIELSQAQLLYDPADGRWKRVANLFGSRRTDKSESTVLRNIITQNTGPLAIRKDGVILWVRDYREAPIPEMEDPYTTACSATTV